MASKLRTLVDSLPGDTAQAVAMLARFEFARPVRQRSENPAVRYYEAETDFAEPDTLAELTHLYFSNKLPDEVYTAFREYIKTPGNLKLRQAAAV